MTNMYILVASECVDELKIPYSEVCSLSGSPGFMHSLMIFLIIGSGFDQFKEFFLVKIPVPVLPITLHSVIIESLCDACCSRKKQNSRNYSLVSNSHSDDDWIKKFVHK